MGNRKVNKQNILVPGDLVVYKDSKEAGILMQKHKVLRHGMSEPADSRWYYAWRIKWNREVDLNSQLDWTKRLESSLDEQKLLRGIKDGEIELYKAKNITCN